MGRMVDHIHSKPEPMPLIIIQPMRTRNQIKYS